MIALGVAATWIAISAAGAKGLVVFARAAAASDFEAEPAPTAPDGRSACDGGYGTAPDGRFAGDKGYGTAAWTQAQSLRP